MGILNTKYKNIDINVLIGTKLDNYYIDNINNGVVHIAPVQTDYYFTFKDLTELKNYGVKNITMYMFCIDPHKTDYKTIMNFEGLHIDCMIAHIGNIYKLKNLEIDCTNLELVDYDNMTDSSQKLKINTMYVIHPDDDVFPVSSDLVNIQSNLFHVFNYIPVDLSMHKGYNYQEYKCKGQIFDVYEIIDVRKFLKDNGYEKQNIIFVSPYSFIKPLMLLYKKFVVDNPKLVDKCKKYDMKYAKKNVIYNNTSTFYVEVDIFDIPDFKRYSY